MHISTFAKLSLSAAIAMSAAACSNTSNLATTQMHPTSSPTVCQKNHDHKLHAGKPAHAHAHRDHDKNHHKAKSHKTKSHKAMPHKNQHKETAWGYHGHTAPQFWGDIAGNETCKLGAEQSPINITQASHNTTSDVQIRFGISDIEVTDNGHTIVYTPTDDKNTTIIDGERYTLKQFHYHTPSEHQLSGVAYPAEMHYVHTNADGNLAVIGVMLNPTAPSDTLQSLVANSQMLSSVIKSQTVEAVDLAKLMPADTGFYHYKGSLTTPPCSEQVQWYVAHMPAAISQNEAMALTQMYEGNNRPVQPQGSRTVELIQ